MKEDLAYFTTGPQDLTNRRYWHYWVYPPTPGKAGCWDNSRLWEATRAGLTGYELLVATEKRTAMLKRRIHAAQNLQDRSIALEYANAVCKNSVTRMEDSRELALVRNQLLDELQALSPAENLALPALCHYRFEGDDVIVELYAPDGTLVSLTADGKNLGLQSVSTLAPAQWRASADSLYGKPLVMEISFAGEKRILKKRLLRPFGK